MAGYGVLNRHEINTGGNKIKIEERIEAYRKAFPKLPCALQVVNGRLAGTWFMGNNYQNKSRYYGAYPGSYVKRVNALFPEKEKVCHLFSGRMPSGDYVRIDSNVNNTPEIVADAENLKIKSRFDIIYADPPYSIEDAEHYGTVMVSRKKVFESCHRALKNKGHLVWLDQVFPMFSKMNWKLVGAIGIIVSTNHRVRFTFIFEKVG